MPYPYGQNKEDVVLTEHFVGKPFGRFLDVGAWTGVTFSNVRVFAERGWAGVCVEPSPSAFVELAKNYADFPSVQLVNVAIADRAGLVDFHDCGGDAVSTLSTAHRNVWAVQQNFRTFTVSTTTVGRLLDRFGVEFDLLSLDVEGNSAALLREFPLGGMPRLKAIVVEHDNQADALATWARQWGFSEAEGTRSGENLILLR